MHRSSKIPAPVLGILVLVLAFILVSAVVLLLVAQPLFTRAGSDASLSFSAERLKEHVNFLAGSGRSFPRADNLEKAATYIRTEFEQSGGRVSEQPFRVDDQTYRNVIVSFGPEDGERVILGAHYDSWGGLPGADDNASGTAVLIEIAKKLKDATLQRRVDLVAYTLEEPPNFRSETMGSWVHAASLKKANVKVRAMIGLEMVGYFRDEPHTQQYPASFLKMIYGDKGNFIVVAGRFGDMRLVRKIKGAMKKAAPLPVHSIDAPAAVTGIDFSDHWCYWKNGYDAVMITDSAFYRNPNYHSAYDTPDTLDYNRMAQVSQQVYAAVLKLANE